MTMEGIASLDPEMGNRFFYPPFALGCQIEGSVSEAQRRESTGLLCHWREVWPQVKKKTFQDIRAGNLSYFVMNGGFED